MATHEDIKKVEMEIFELTQKLNGMRKTAIGEEIKNYEFNTLSGPTNLKALFGEKNKLMVIHNMGQACRYCTLWADGINAFLPHLESTISVVLASKDDPETQRHFANFRNWRFRMVSHGGGEYIQEQSVEEDHKNYPGVAVYELKDDKVYLKNKTAFGPYDQFCAAWNFLSLAGLSESTWTPQYNYWKRPEKMDDGGANLN